MGGTANAPVGKLRSHCWGKGWIGPFKVFAGLCIDHDASPICPVFPVYPLLAFLRPVRHQRSISLSSLPLECPLPSLALLIAPSRPYSLVLHRLNQAAALHCCTRATLRLAICNMSQDDGNRNQSAATLGDDVDVNWEDWLDQPTSDPFMGAEVG